MTNDLAFADRFKAAQTLALAVKGFPVETAEQHGEMEARLKDIRALEAALEDEYKRHPIVVQARQIQAQKSELAKMLEDARRTGKQAQLAYENEQELLRLKKEAEILAAEKKRAEDEALALAQEAQAVGDQERADAIINEPVHIPAVVLPQTTPKTKSQVRWRFRIVNKDAIPRQYLMPDEVCIGRVVTALKGSTNIPGVEAYPVKL